MSKQIKFGTDGWRGIIGQDFNLKNVAVVAQAIADYLIRVAAHRSGARKVVVGYDTRKLSKPAARRISQVLTANKIKVMLAKQPLPTQAVSYAVRSRACTLGIMVTASHNPVQFNGIKIKGNFGGPVESRITDRIEQLLFKRRVQILPLTQARKLRLLQITDLVGDYLRFARAYLDMPLLKKAQLDILVDSMHGTADAYIAELLKGSSCKVTTIHQAFDSSFGGIKPEPIAPCLREAANLMRRRRFDLGLATDGDADRIAAFDHKGRFITPQQIIVLLLLHLIQQRRLKGGVVKTISGTTVLERIAKKYKLKVYETPVGFKHISRLMQTKDILIGGEEAGGIGFKHYLPERDGIVAGLLLIEMMAARDKSLSALLEEVNREFGRYVYLRKDLRCSAGQKKKMKQKLNNLRRRSSLAGVKVSRVKDFDGLKFYLSDGSWILFRLSGTEPIVRIYAESHSLAKTKRLIAEGERFLG